MPPTSVIHLVPKPSSIIMGNNLFKMQMWSLSFCVIDLALSSCPVTFTSNPDCMFPHYYLLSLVSTLFFVFCSLLLVRLVHPPVPCFMWLCLHISPESVEDLLFFRTSDCLLPITTPFSLPRFHVPLEGRVYWFVNIAPLSPPLDQVAWKFALLFIHYQCLHLGNVWVTDFFSDISHLLWDHHGPSFYLATRC